MNRTPGYRQIKANESIKAKKLSYDFVFTILLLEHPDNGITLNGTE